MPTAEKIIKEIYHLPMEEKEKVVRYIIEFGIKGAHHDFPELLNIKEWQDEIANKPFNLKQASEYLGVSAVTLRRCKASQRTEKSPCDKRTCKRTMNISIPSPFPPSLPR